MGTIPLANPVPTSRPVAAIEHPATRSELCLESFALGKVFLKARILSEVLGYGKSTAESSLKAYSRYPGSCQSELGPRGRRPASRGSRCGPTARFTPSEPSGRRPRQRPAQLQARPGPLRRGQGADLSRAIAPCYTDGMAR